MKMDVDDASGELPLDLIPLRMKEICRLCATQDDLEYKKMSPKIVKLIDKLLQLRVSDLSQMRL